MSQTFRIHEFTLQLMIKPYQMIIDVMSCWCRHVTKFLTWRCTPVTANNQCVPVNEGWQINTFKIWIYIVKDTSLPLVTLKFANWNFNITRENKDCMEKLKNLIVGKTEEATWDKKKPICSCFLNQKDNLLRIEKKVFMGKKIRANCLDLRDYVIIHKNKNPWVYHLFD